MESTNAIVGALKIGIIIIITINVSIFIIVHLEID